MSAIVCLTLFDILKRRMVSSASASFREIIKKWGVYKIKMRIVVNTDKDFRGPSDIKVIVLCFA